MSQAFRIIGAVVVLVALVLGGFALLVRFNPAMQDRVITLAVETAIGRQMRLAQEDPTIPNARLGQDNLDIVFCGTASPMGGNNLAQSCIAVFAGPHFYLIDTGPRSASRLVQFGLPVGRLDGVLFTHYHSDHIGGLGEVHLQSWVQGRRGKLPVYGGTGIQAIADGFNEAYGLDYIYRSEHHGTDLLSPQSAGVKAQLIEMENERSEVIKNSGLVISAIKVVHDPIEPALGYIVEYQGRKVVISGDTIAVDTIRQAAQDADVLIHETLEPRLVNLTAQTLGANGNLRIARILRDTLDYHTTPAEAAKIANDANARLLVFTHMAPVPANALVAQAFRREADKLRPAEQTILATDGMQLRLPTGSTEILQLMRE